MARYTISPNLADLILVERLVVEFLVSLALSVRGARNQTLTHTLKAAQFHPLPQEVMVLLSGVRLAERCAKSWLNTTLAQDVVNKAVLQPKNLLTTIKNRMLASTRLKRVNPHRTLIVDQPL
jgi:hypothetical protein